MGRIRTCSLLVGMVVSLAASSVAVGGIVVQVFDPGDLSPGPFTVEDFEDEILEPGVTYSTPGDTYPDNPFRATHDDASGGVGPSGEWGLAASPGPMILTFDVPATSVGMWVGNDQGGGLEAVLSIFDAGGFVDSISIFMNGNDWVDEFLGFNSTGIAVTRVELDYNSGLAEYVDDVYFNIPGPGALPLLVVAGLAGRPRRRR